MAKTLDALYIYIYIYIWINLTNKSIKNIIKNYLSITGLFAKEKIFLANNRVRDG